MKIPQVLTYIFERFQNLVSTSSHVLGEGRLTFLTLQGDHRQRAISSTQGCPCF